jgi:exonuclease SbcC
MRVVVALGGNALLRRGEPMTAAVQRTNVALAALALADLKRGGLRLGTLFIDEGFGSLDQDALDQAIATLSELQMGGRMIGIISHVSELKEQMPLRVDVSTSRRGSTVAIHGV